VASASPSPQPSSYTLANADIEVVAVCGDYKGNAHWWVRSGNLRLDATRNQFDSGPMIAPVDTYHGYHVESEFPPGWTREHVILECRRAFYFAGAADQFGEQLLRMLEMAVREATRAIKSARSEPCAAETWSWDHFTPNQVDPYWIRCTLWGDHDEHEDENTGLTWKPKSA
jgi:hypothetical protein